MNPCNLVADASKCRAQTAIAREARGAARAPPAVPCRCRGWRQGATWVRMGVGPPGGEEAAATACHPGALGGGVAGPEKKLQTTKSTQIHPPSAALSHLSHTSAKLSSCCCAQSIPARLPRSFSWPYCGGATLTPCLTASLSVSGEAGGCGDRGASQTAASGVPGCAMADLWCPRNHWGHRAAAGGLLRVRSLCSSHRDGQQQTRRARP
jgi:hypothetical protein